MPAKDWRYERPRNGWGVAALVLAVVSLAIGVIPIAGDLVAIPLAVAAIACGFRGFMRAEDGLASNPGTAVSGMVLGAIAVLSPLLTLLTVLEE